MTERRCKWLMQAAVGLSFVLVSLASAPIPGVNEPHYLGKAKHEWDTTWCAGDLFLESFPAHRVFYWSCGWLTRWFELSIVALLGRLVTCALLAAAWTTLISRWQFSTAGGVSSEGEPRGAPLLAAWVFVGLQAIGSFSGEWLIGGFESKGLAYAFVLWAIAAMLDRKILLASLCSAAATSMHPVIGLWHVAALGLATMLETFFLKSVNSAPGPSRAQYLGASLLFVVVALPGLWPALQMLRQGDASTNYAANYIQVFYRLKHHLDPMDFGADSYVGYGILATAWIVALVWWRRRHGLSAQDCWWASYVAATGLFALTGFVAGFGPRPAELMPGFRWRMVLLKFYPFRLFDLMLPVAVAAMVPRWLRHPSRWLIGGAAFAWAIVAHQVLPPPNRLPSNMRQDWLAACRWVAANTPRDAIFHTPFEAEAFKWFAERAEYVNFKDCPQDSLGIVEWNRRQRLMTKWSEASFADDQRYSAAELRELVRLTNVRLAITRARVNYEADLLYENNSYKIWRLPAIHESEGAASSTRGGQ